MSSKATRVSSSTRASQSTRTTSNSSFSPRAVVTVTVSPGATPSGARPASIGTVCRLVQAASMAAVISAIELRAHGWRDCAGASMASTRNADN
jgi:hypothetical protein